MPLGNPLDVSGLTGPTSCRWIPGAPLLRQGYEVQTLFAQLIWIKYFIQGKCAKSQREGNMNAIGVEDKRILELENELQNLLVKCCGRRSLLRETDIAQLRALEILYVERYSMVHDIKPDWLPTRSRKKFKQHLAARICQAA
jgi:hypothetical protein